MPTTSDSTRQGVSTELSSGPESRWCWIPPRLHTPTVAIPAGQRVGSPASTGARTQTSVRIPCGRGRRPPTRFVCAGHRPATREPEDRQNRAVSIPPPGMGEGPLTAFPQVRGPLTHSVAGEGFEPSKLSRWIYSPLPLAARATCLGADGRIATQPRCSSNRAAVARQTTPPIPSSHRG